MKKIFFFLVVILTLSFTLHKFHLSNTIIVLNNKENTLQITMRCFVDDIENTINKEEHIFLELGNERELPNANNYLKRYLLTNFKITIDDSPQNLIFLGKEVEKNIIYFYFEITDVHQFSKLQISNKILLKEFDDQQNIIRLQIHKKNKTFVLKNANYVETYNIN